MAQQPKLLLKCEFCELEIWDNGERVNENPLCNHKLVPAGELKDRPSPAPPSPAPISPNAGGAVLLNPEWDEMKAFSQTRATLKDCKNHIEKYNTELTQLNETFALCQQNLQEEFNNLKTKLVERHDELFDQLDVEYNKRRDKLKYFLSELKEYKSNLERCDQDCKQNIIESVDSTEEEIEARVKKNVEQYDALFNSKPPVYEISIALKYQFDAHHSKMMKQIDLYGFLQGKDVNVESGKFLPWVTLRVPGKPQVVTQLNNNNKNKNSNNNNNRRYNNNNNNYNDIDSINHRQEKQAYIPPPSIDYNEYVPTVKRCALKYKDGNLLLTYAPRDPESIEDDNKEYEQAKKQNIFLHIQCLQANQSDSNVNWEQPNQLKVDLYLLMPLPNMKGKYEHNLTEYLNYFESNTNAVLRTRYEYLSDVNCVQQGRFIGEQTDILACGNWTQPKSSTLLTHQQQPMQQSIPQMQQPMSPMQMNDDIPPMNLPEKVKVKAKVTGLNGKTVVKQWSLKQKEDQYKVDAIYALAAKALKIPNENCVFKIILDSGNGQFITNDSEVIQNIVTSDKVVDDKYNALLSVRQVS